VATFTNDRLGASFTLPDRPSVRQQLAYFSEAGIARGQELFERYWRGALTIIQDWKCAALPDPNIDLDALDDPKATEVILWAGIAAKNHMDALDNVPKNS
jgi:hypothetical protein